MKILIINYHFPPSKTAHSYRWAQLVSHFKSQGHNVDVIAGGSAGECDTTDNISRFNFPCTVKPGMGGVKSSPTHVSQHSYVKKLKQKYIHKLKKAYRFIFWPDGLWHWLPLALFGILLKKNKKYDLVIGYSPTFSAVLAAFFYKFLNRKTRLIIDFGDPFSVSEAMPVNNYQLYKRLNYFSELKIFQDAFKITFTNEATFKLYKEKYPQITTFEVLPHLVDIDLFYKKHFVKNSESLSLGYVGAFHKGIREPELAIKVLEKLSVNLPSFNADFYGPLNGVRFKESNHLSHKGIVPREEAIKLLQSFDFIINVENEDCPMTPSKINEYVALGKPVINFLSKTNESCFENYPLVFNVSEETDTVDLMAFIEKNKLKQLSRIEVDTLLKGNTLSYIAEQYLAN